MIKSKIDARERALELAVNASKSAHTHASTIVLNAKEFESYLIGDAELPEVTDDNAHIKELLEIANKSFNSGLKTSNEEYNCIFKGGNTDAPNEIPCKSEVE